MIKIKNINYEIANELSELELDVLRNIYLLRCLTIKQIYVNFFKDSYDYTIFYKEIFTKLIDYNLIEIVKFKDKNDAVFLTSSGIEVIRYNFNLPSNIYDSSRKVVKRGYYRAGELKLLPKLINHQIHLNQFMLDFDKYFKKLNAKMNRAFNLKYNYYDEKYVSQYVNIRPDALIQLLDIDIFLEMDMSTESQKQLEEKWKNYRRFLSTREYKYKEKDIKVFFIIDGTNNVENRKNLVRFSASKILLDTFNNQFEMYIGTRYELLNLIFQKIIPKLLQACCYSETIKDILYSKHNFHISNGNCLKKYLLNTEYEYYIRKIEDNNSLVIENNKVQEFLFDDYFFRPFSILKKIAYLRRNSSCFKNVFNRDIDYLVLVKDIDTLYNDLKVCDLIGVKGVYFTTLDRLKNKEFHEAIFQIDSLSNLYHFENNGLEKRIFEFNLEDK